MSVRRTRQILLGVTFCVTFCGVALSALTAFDVQPVSPTRQQNEAAALAQARERCVRSLSSAVADRTGALPTEAMEIAGRRCELLFAADPIATLIPGFGTDDI